MALIRSLFQNRIREKEKSNITTDLIVITISSTCALLTVGHDLTFCLHYPLSESDCVPSNCRTKLRTIRYNLQLAMCSNYYVSVQNFTVAGFADRSKAFQSLFKRSVRLCFLVGLCHGPIYPPLNSFIRFIDCFLVLLSVLGLNLIRSGGSGLRNQFSFLKRLVSNGLLYLFIIPFLPEMRIRNFPCSTPNPCRAVVPLIISRELGTGGT